MDDYREMYYHLAHATEKAVRLLIQAQQECEDLYLSEKTTPCHIQLVETEDNNAQSASQP